MTTRWDERVVVSLASPVPRFVRPSVVLAILTVAAVAGDAAATARAAQPLRVTGVVRDDAGEPVAGARVSLAVQPWSASGGGPTSSTAAMTDALGRYALPDVLGDVPVAALWRATAAVDADGESLPPVDVRAILERGASDGHAQLDLVAPAFTATLSGRLVLRPSGAAISPAPFLQGSGSSIRRSTVTIRSPEIGLRQAPVDDAGRWSARVPAGRYQLTAEAPGALPTQWPDLPAMSEVAQPAIAVARGEARTADISMRARLPYGARDEYGRFHAGYDPDDQRGRAVEWDVAVPSCYPVDAHVSAHVGAGSRASVADAEGRPVAVTGPRVVRAGSGFAVPIANTGDDTLRLDGVRLEGPGAGAYRVPSTWSLIRCAPQLSLAPGAAAGGYGIWFDPTGIAARPPFRFDVVIPHGQGELRVPVEARDLGPGPLSWPGLLGDGGTAGTVPKAPRPSGTAPTLASLSLSARKLRVQLPGAGAATVVFQRRTTGHRPRWRTVRTVRLRARGAGEIARSMPRLRPGRYRVRLRTAVPGQPARAITVFHRVRAR
jgi:hypothetical protein